MTKKSLSNRIHGWFPKEPSISQGHRVKVVTVQLRLQALRLSYSVLLGALLFTPFGIYHSITQPYVAGALWGYQLPVGYVGLLLGVLMAVYPKVGKLKTLPFSLLMVIAGASLGAALLFSPNTYFINLLHGTHFSPSQIDVDFALGNPAVLGLSLLSLAGGLVAFASKKIHPPRSR
jgi:hypothetical protein